MIIIIEGIDRVGKTTLADAIKEKFNIPIFKQERVGGNDLSTQFMSDVNYGSTLGQIRFWNWSGFNDHIIVDRFHWTEAVYSLIDRNNDKPMEHIPSIEAYMSQCKDKYLIVQVMPTDIEWSSTQHGADLSRHQAQFDMLYDKCNLNKCRCDRFSYDYVLNKIGHYLHPDVSQKLTRRKHGSQ